MIYTQAGGSYVVARENFGPKVAQIASVALLIDYIVTVAVQAAAGHGGDHLARARRCAARDQPRRSRSRSCCCSPSATCAACARPARRSRSRPTSSSPWPGWSSSSASSASSFGDLPVLPHVGGMIGVHDSRACDLHRRGDLRAAQGLRQRRRVADRARGDLQRRQRVQEAGRAQRAHDAVDHERACSARWCSASPTWPSRRTRRRTSSGTPTVISQVAQAVFGTAWYGHLGFVLVQIATALILYHRREHAVHRLPVPGQLHRRGLVPAAADDPTRAPARLQQRHHRADGRRARPDPGGRRGRRRADPVLRDRRVHRVHAWPASAWRSTTARTASAGWRRAAGDQPDRRRRVGAGRR